MSQDARSREQSCVGSVVSKVANGIREEVEEAKTWLLSIRLVDEELSGEKVASG